MPRKKTADKLTSRNEILERLWLSAAKKLLAQLETEGADMSASMFSTITKFLSLNNFDAEALAKVQRERTLMENFQKTGKIEQAQSEKTNFDVSPIDPVFEMELKEQLRQIPEFDAGSKGRIPDATNQ